MRPPKQDPKTSQWLWDERERARQKKRTEHFREIMRLQQESADPLVNIEHEDDSAATRDALEKMTRLTDITQMSNFLSYGKWDLSGADIERLNKDEEMKQRVRQKRKEVEGINDADRVVVSQSVSQSVLQGRVFM
jgi:pyruvate/2-oxoacid:ferredoxin oxidoreductase alpha subunit